MSITVSKNLQQRIKLLKAEVNSLNVIKSNYNSLDKDRLREAYKQYMICRQLLRQELIKAPIERLL